MRDDFGSDSGRSVLPKGDRDIRWFDSVTVVVTVMQWEEMIIQQIQAVATRTTVAGEHPKLLFPKYIWSKERSFMEQRDSESVCF